MLELLNVPCKLMCAIPPSPDGSAKNALAFTQASLNDSHNIASGTDNGTGDYTYAHTNNYNNATYANAGNVQTDARRCQYVRSIATSSLRVRHWNEDGGYNDVINAVQMTGDLA